MKRVPYRIQRGGAGDSRRRIEHKAKVVIVRINDGWRRGGGWAESSGGGIGPASR